MKKYWELYTDKFGGTIFHPQFIMLSYTKDAFKEIKKYSKNKNLIDIGCGRMPYREKLEPIVKRYIGVDHPKISSLYNPGKKPDILADITKKIPVKDKSFEIVIMLEVLEYLENPVKTFSEIRRILKPNGVLIFTSPFLYPLHDIPYDRNRFTDTQIKTFLANEKFEILKLKIHGGFLSFWFQSLNVFLLKSILDILKSKKNISSFFCLGFLMLITPICVLFTNCVFVLIGDLKFLNLTNYFPMDYLVVGVKV